MSPKHRTGRVRSTRPIHWHTLVPGLLGPGRAVVDLGANIGLFCREILRDFRCTVYAVEPDPELRALIPRGPRVNVLGYAIAAGRGVATLAISDNRLGATILPTDSGAVRTRMEVETLGIADLIEGYVKEPIGVIKMDIEGAEIAALDAMPDELIERVPQFTVEFHDFNGRVPAAEVQRIVRRFQRLGYYYLRMSGVGHQDTLFVHRGTGVFDRIDYVLTKYIARYTRGGSRVLRRKLGLPPPGSPARGRAGGITVPAGVLAELEEGAPAETPVGAGDRR